MNLYMIITKESNGAGLYWVEAETPEIAVSNFDTAIVCISHRKIK